MKITRQTAAQKIIAYLYHHISLAELVDWAETAMMDGDFEDRKSDVLREIVSRLGLADVKAFGISWENCEQYLSELGYTVQITVTENLMAA
jgi:hypothetical protein